MIEKPPPLSFPNLKPVFSPKDALKQMLESVNRKDQSLDSPLDEIDPSSLDEFTARIDSGFLALNQIPDPSDIEKIVQIYIRMKDKFNLEIQMGITSRPKRRTAKPSASQKSMAEMLKDQLEEEE